MVERHLVWGQVSAGTGLCTIDISVTRAEFSMALSHVIVFKLKWLECTLAFWFTVLVSDEFAALKWMINKWNVYWMVKKRTSSTLYKVPISNKVSVSWTHWLLYSYSDGRLYFLEWDRSGCKGWDTGGRIPKDVYGNCRIPVGLLMLTAIKSVHNPQNKMRW